MMVVEQILKELDTAVRPNPTTFVVRMQNARSSDVADLLNQAFGNTGRGNGSGSPYGAGANSPFGTGASGRFGNQGAGGGQRGQGGGGFGGGPGAGSNSGR